MRESSAYICKIAPYIYAGKLYKYIYNNPYTYMNKALQMQKSTANAEKALQMQKKHCM